MSETIRMISRLSLAVPAIAAIVRYRSFTFRVMPFLWLILAGVISETVSFYLDSKPPGYSNVWANFYVASEWVLIMLLFYRWDAERKKYARAYLLVCAAALLIHITEAFYFNRIAYVCEVARILNSFIICLLSVNHINRLIISEKKSVIRHPEFIISCAFVFYFAYKVLVEVFYMHVDGYFNPPLTEADRNNPSPAYRLANSIYSVHDYVNTIFNLILAYAIICLPRKHTYFSKP